MILQYMSDLHLEFKENKELLNRKPIEPKADVLILAGDIVPFAEMDKHKDFFDYISDHFKTTYWIPGNHEYYRFDLSQKCGTFKESVRNNVHLVNNYKIVVEGINLIFSTMWTHIGLWSEWDITRSLRDFSVIEFERKRLKVGQYNQLHAESIRFISSELKACLDKTIVVTHHVPTYMHYPAVYKGSSLNSAFAVELQDLIDSDGPDYWIYGHHHANTPEFSIGKTKLVTNQLGYVAYGEHLEFDWNRVVEV